MIKTACLWLAAVVFVTSIGLAVTQAPGPKDPGEVTLNRACTVCHTLSEVTKFKGFYNRDQWADVVRTMRADGAQVKDDEVAALVDYLFKTFGKVEPPAVDGKKLLETSCTGCHDLETATGPRLSKVDWQDVIVRMVSRGAQVEDAQIPALAEYMFKNFGPK